jgi:hypothetical protein
LRNFVFQTNGYLIINKNERIRCEEYIADEEYFSDSSEEEEGATEEDINTDGSGTCVTSTQSQNRGTRALT